MNELVDAVSQTRTDVVDLHLNQSKAQLEEIVQQGIDSNEFESCDVEQVSQGLLTAGFICDYPSLMGLHPLSIFEAKAIASVWKPTDGRQPMSVAN